MKLLPITKPAAIMAVIASALSSCASVDMSQASDAVLSPSTPQARAEITDIVTTALGHSNFQISEITLTKRAFLSLELATPPGLAGQRIMGRRMDTPESFILKTLGQKCYLEHQSTEQAYRVKSATCRAL